MSNNKQRLELTWIGKNNPEYDIANIEPRILEERTDLSYGDKDTENMIIHGDNLLALKALLPEYEGKVKCIYIDPPYNTGNAFEHYDDSVEHSTWLSLMKPRLELFKLLLAKDGVLFVHTDDNEQAYLKVLLDEVFMRTNYLNTICVKAKSSSGASGGGEDKKLKKNIEIITVYRRSSDFIKFNDQYVDVALNKYISNLADEGKAFAYNSVLVSEGEKEYYGSTKDGRGEEIKIYKHSNYIIKSVNQFAKELDISGEEVYSLYFDKIFTLENAQTSIRDRVVEATDNDDNYYSIEYYPISGRNKGNLTHVVFIGKTKRLLSYLKNTCTEKKGKVFKRIKVGTLWDDLSWSGVSFEGGVDFPNGKKPETLVERIISMSTNSGDLVLDSFLGSGTTASVAHKMGRKYIGVEMGEQAYTHIHKRIKNIIEGVDLGGISKSQEWNGGGGFKFYELAPSFVTIDEYGNSVIDTYYNEVKLIRAMCKLTNYTFTPSPSDYWKHGKGQGNNNIYVTTQMLSVAMVQQIVSHLGINETLLICPKKFEPGCENVDSRITIKKIPQSILKACQFGKKEYLLPIKERAMEEVDEDDDSDEE